MIGELKFVVTRKLIYVTGVLALFMAVKTIPVVLLNRRCAFVNVISRTFVTFIGKDNILIKFYGLIHGHFTALLFHNRAVVYENLNQERNRVKCFLRIKKRIEITLWNGS